MRPSEKGMPDDRPVPESTSVADRVLAVMRDQPADPGFGDHLATTVRQLRSRSSAAEREWPND